MKLILKKIILKYRRFLVFISLMSMYTLNLVIYIKIWHDFYPEATFPDRGNTVVILLYMFLSSLCITVFRANKVGTLRLIELIYSNILSSILVNFITYLQLCTIAAKILKTYPITMIFILQACVIFIFCYASNRLYYLFKQSREILVISNNINIDYEVILKMQKIKEKYTIKKVIKEDEEKEEIYNQINKFSSILISNIDPAFKKEIIEYCFEKEKRVYILPNVYDIIIFSSENTQLFDTPIIMCEMKTPSNEQLILKRLIDIILSLIGLIILMPFMIISAILIKLYDNGPIFFKQKRCTINEQEFYVLKFRSMIVDAEKNGVKKAIQNDNRITPIGKFLRLTRLDETPQIINILKGEMSIVGPRPERIEHIEEYSKLYEPFRLRLKVKAGLTGYAQIYGKYNTTPVDKLHLDLLYIQRFSILNDLKLILATIKILFMPNSTEGFKDK